MTAREYLEQYRELDIAIENKRAELEKLRAKAEAVTPCGGGSPNGSVSDKVGLNAAKLVDLENEINEDIEKLFYIRDDIRKQIKAIPSIRLQNILEDIYIHGKTLATMAEKRGCCDKQISRMHKAALSYIKISADVPECP